MPIHSDHHQGPKFAPCRVRGQVWPDRRVRARSAIVGDPRGRFVRRGRKQHFGGVKIGSASLVKSCKLGERESHGSWVEHGRGPWGGGSGWGEMAHHHAIWVRCENFGAARYSCLRCFAGVASSTPSRSILWVSLAGSHLAPVSHASRSRPIHSGYPLDASELAYGARGLGPTPPF